MSVDKNSINNRGKNITKEYGQHHAFREGGIDNPDEHHQESDEQAV
jgi:hypothetical protein